MNTITNKHNTEETQSKSSFRNNVWQLVRLNIISILSNKGLMLEILLINILAICLSIFFIPIAYSGGIYTIMAIAVPLLIILGNIGYKLKKSTIYNNVMLSTTTNFQFYFSLLLTTIIFGNIISLFFWSTVQLIGIFPLFMYTWFFEGYATTTVNIFKYGTWINIIYVAQVTSLLVFSLYYLISSFLQNNVTYYIIVMVFLILGIIFGGTINTYFTWPYKIEFYNVVEIDFPEGAYWHMDKASQVVYMNQIAIDTIVELGPTTYNENGIVPMYNLFPETMFIPTLFYPFYGIGEFSSCSITKHMNQDVEFWMNAKIYVVDGPTTLNLDNYWGPGVLSPDHISWKSWYHVSWGPKEWMWTMVILQPYIWSGFSLTTGSILRHIKS